MSKRSDQQFVADIRQAIRRIRTYTSEMTYASFSADSKTQDAVIRNREILGEAAKNISQPFKEQHINVPWREMARTRDRLIHHYFGVNIDILW